MKFWVIVLVACHVTVKAATITADSTSREDAGAAVAVAVDGDTVVLPSGTNEWVEKLNITNAITLQGQGATTLILDNADTDLGILQLSADNSRVTQISFGKGTRTTQYFSGMLRTGSTANNVRIDHCDFRPLQNRAIYWYGRRGVIDHNTFSMDGDQFIYIKHQDWDADGTVDYGDKSWADDYVWGAPDAVFIEDNTFTQVDASVYGLDSDSGCRVVFRYNTIDTHVTMHGTESSAPYRGGQAWEVYSNFFRGNDVPSGQEAVTLRSGSAVIWGNTFTNDTDYPAIIRAYDYRTIGTFGIWSGAQGTNAFDDNVAGTQDTGTATAGAALAMTDSAKSWTINQFVEPGFIFILLNLNSDGSEKSASKISTNSTDTIYFSAAFTGNEDMAFNVGDGYEIRKIDTTLDQVGYIGGDLLDRGESRAWPNQVLSPVYVWGNTYGDGTVINIDDHSSTSGYYEIVKGTHIKFEERPDYTPYTYPHPLVASASEAEAAVTISGSGVTITGSGATLTTE